MTDDFLARLVPEDSPGLGDHDLIHLAGEAAVVVLVEDFIERTGSPEEIKAELRGLLTTRRDG